jgi:predicted ATPase/DNA-binding winged helix-turn-helix (wHTH) protein
MTSQRSYAFDTFQLFPDRRLLLAQGQPVKLGGRALDLLVALVQGRHAVVSKQQLLDQVWPGLVVEEANIAVQVLALRTILGHAAIATVPGRGYRFALPTVEAGHPLAATPVTAPMPSATPTRRTNLPERADALFGRDRDLQTLTGLLQRRPLVTLLGTGGVGKTRLAQRVALDLLPYFAEGVWWIELAALSDPALVAATVARVLRTEPGPHRDAATAVATTLRDGQSLLVFDNAEHVIDGVQALVAHLLEHAPQAKLLVTSQSAMRMPGEQIMRLGPLSLPADDSLAGVGRSGAVALFAARAQALDAEFRITDANCPAVADICRRLDGIPLAIELAVARLPLLGLDGLRTRLNDRFRVLTRHARAALPRHRTLLAALDWSHGLLEAHEQRVLRRLGVFAGGFTLEAAQQVAGDDPLDAWAVLETLGALVDKSLVLAEGQEVPRYQLLETTRLYALEQLGAAGEAALTRERHARSLDAFLRVERDDARFWRTPPAPPAVLVAEIDNARAALDWVTTHDDDALAVSLAAGASHVFLTASLNAEYLQRVLPLRDRARDDLPLAQTGLFWARIALACSRNAHPAGLDAALRAAQAYRSLGDPGRLYDALTWTIAIGSRLGQVDALKVLVDEAERLEQPHWPPALRSSFQWAKHRWLQMQGRSEDALACAEAQARLLALDDNWRVHVAWGANVADCELSLGRAAQAQARAAAALAALDALGIAENIVGHVMDSQMVALTLLRRDHEAVQIGRRARRLLEREGDELRLLDTLALNATTGERWLDAARIAGHVDAAMAHSGESRWPSVAERREVLERRLDAALPPLLKQQALAAGASLSREAAFALAFGDAVAGGGPVSADRALPGITF